MKRILFFAAIVSAVLFGFTGCEDTSLKGNATYYGTVINEYTDAPLANATIRVTNGDNIHTTTTTAEDGLFSLEVRLAEIDEGYYIQISGNRIETKKVKIPAYGNDKYDVGIIMVKGPTTIPVVETKVIRVDGQKLVYCEGVVKDEGESSVTERGICWGTSTPTIKNNKMTCGEGKGAFSCQIDNITNVHSQNLYFRAYATNENGTAYGEAIMIDHRNPYQLPTVTEGSVTWMVLPYDLPNANMNNRAYSGSNYAQQNCQALEAYDYSDWDLPTISVLELLYTHRNEIGGFSDQQYWSCSGGGSSYEWWFINFSSGYKGTTYGSSYGVRPVRKY